MIDKILADLEAINQELQSRGIMFHNDRIKAIRKALRQMDSKIFNLELEARKSANLEQEHVTKIMDLTRRLLNKEVDIEEQKMESSSFPGMATYRNPYSNDFNPRNPERMCGK